MSRSEDRWAGLGPQAVRTFVVTGANSGIGSAVTRALVLAGAHVVLAVRDPARGEHAAARLSGPPGSTSVVKLDLADLADLADLGDVVRNAASLLDRCDHLTGLVCNAGVMGGPLLRSVQGFELQMATNHLGQRRRGSSGRRRDPPAGPAAATRRTSPPRRHQPRGEHNRAPICRSGSAVDVTCPRPPNPWWRVHRSCRTHATARAAGPARRLPVRAGAGDSHAPVAPDRASPRRSRAGLTERATLPVRPATQRHRPRSHRDAASPRDRPITPHRRRPSAGGAEKP
jgi:NAD(P)-dependent dehydrogenase (short-subunit alcohol dehydrogenase family)